MGKCIEMMIIPKSPEQPKKKETEPMSRNSQMHLGVITLNRAEVHFGAVEAYVMTSITSCVFIFISSPVP